MYNLKDLRCIYSVVCPFEFSGSGDGYIARFSKRIRRHIVDMQPDLRLCKWERDYLLFNLDECADVIPDFVQQALMNVCYKDMERVDYDIPDSFTTYIDEKLFPIVEGTTLGGVAV